MSKKWGDNFELGRAGSNFSGNSGGGRTGSGSSWVSKLPMKLKGGGITRGVPKKGVVRKGTGSKPE